MISRAKAKIYIEHYGKLIDKLMDAQLALVDGGVQSYTIDDRSLTRFDLPEIEDELERAINKKAEFEAIFNGQKARKAVGVVPRDY